MNYFIENHEHCSVITTNVAKLDASNAAELKSELLMLNKNNVNNIVIDLSQSKYCDSSGLSSILIANRLCKDSNGQFMLSGLQPSVAKMISIAQLDRVLTITKDLPEALNLMAK